MAPCSPLCRGVLPSAGCLPRGIGCLPLYLLMRLPLRSTGCLPLRQGVLPSTGCLPRGNGCLRPCAEEYSPAGLSRRMMASMISARPRLIKLESGTTCPVRRRTDIHDRRALTVMWSVRCLITALCLCGHCAWSNNASTRSFLRVMEAGMPHKLRQRIKSGTQLVVINSPSKDMAVGREPARQQTP